MVDNHILLQSARWYIIIGVCLHDPVLCNKQINTKKKKKKKKKKDMAKSGHRKFHLVFPFLSSILKYGTEIFILAFHCYSHVFMFC